MTVTLSGTSGVSLCDTNSVSTAALQANAVSAAKMASGAARTNFGAGAVLQVVQAIATDPLSISTGSNYNFVDITGLSVSITPSSSNSKILLITHVSAGSVSPGNTILRFVRNGSAIGVGTGSGYNSYGFTSYYAAVSANYIYTNSTMSGQYLDSPNTTSSLTYKVQFSGDYAGAMTFNRREADTRFSTTSTLTVMEIAG